MSQAKKLFLKAFEQPRAERSGAYKEGVIDGLRYFHGESKDSKCPFEIGTAEADAWGAGWQESRDIYNRESEWWIP